MIVEFQFDTPLLETAVREVPAGEVAIEQLDAAGSVPLRSVCWLENGYAEAFRAALQGDRTVDEARRVVDTDRGHQFEVIYRKSCTGTEMYKAAVESGGIFITGTRRADHWEVQMQFPDRSSFATFRESWTGDPSILAVHEQETAPSAEQYGISEAQREVLVLAAREGYFDVPRQASLADLADELDVSSQAASERLRRGLDSLVERALLTPE